MNRLSRAPVSLLPIFRSEAQYRLVGELFTDPAGERTIGELATLIGASHATVSREVARLEEAGLLRSSEVGRNRFVSPVSDTPVFRPLRDLMAVVYGVPAIVREEFAGLGARVEIFGSWAARWHGDRGPTPHDVDVLVLGDLDPTVAWDAAARASQRAGIEVNVVVRSQEEWEGDDSGFAQTVRSTPRIPIHSGPDDANLGLAP
jgi:DNA-binding transcriptional ArsR family regulator